MAQKSIVPYIESVYHDFTPMEKVIADFFIHNTELVDFSSKGISKRLFVSEASLSRFAKKCGYEGYREFLFHYKAGFIDAETLQGNETKNVLETYQELLNKSYSLIDEEQLKRIGKLFLEHNRIYVYGKGSSGLVCEEMRLRFMRIGINLEAITDSHIMRMNSVLVSEDCVVAGISISGRTPEVLDSLRAAKERGATVVMFTSRKEKKLEDFCDEIVLFAVKDHLENGKAISPQFPILVMVDILYSYCLESDKFYKEALHDYTLNALQQPSGGGAPGV